MGGLPSTATGTISIENQVPKVGYCSFEGSEVTGKPGHAEFVRRAEHLGTLSPNSSVGQSLIIS